LQWLASDRSRRHGPRRLVSGDHTQVRFREQITYGNCLDGGEVTLRFVHGALSFTWHGRDNVGTFITVVAELRGD
jgi:hypothetical protein